MNTNKKVPVDQLQIGMYVAQLDRPWLDTPFLFQGFYIRDDDEISELKVHCEHVFVTLESLPIQPAEQTGTVQKLAVISEETDEHKTQSRMRPISKPRTTEKADGVVRQKNVVYKDDTTLKKEISTASGAHEQAAATVQGVMDKLKSSGNLDLEGLDAAVTPMVDSVLRNPAALACLMRMQQKDDYLYHHSLASSVWAAILGRQIGLSRADILVIAYGAMLLDIGKTQLPDAILNKPGKLTDEERQLMRQHVRFGLDILQKAGKVDPRILDMVAHHHERYNGTGYPAGLSGNDIPVFGRIAGIVDAYDAMITYRPYAKLISSYDALRQLRVLADVEFQAEIVEQFTRAIGVFPTGTLVELNTGEVAIVTKQNRIRRLRPEVMVIMDANKELLEQFRVRDLNEEKVTSQGEQSLWIDCGLPPGTYGINESEFFLN